MIMALTKIVGRGILLVGFFALVVSALNARAVEPGITFATGGIDLKIDSEATYNGLPWPSGTWELKNLVPGVDKFFNFSDIKPGDYGENTVSMHVENSDAYVCLDFKNLKSSENGENEPESQADLSEGGELALNMEFFAWFDDGDNKFEKYEPPIFGTSTQEATDVLNDKTYTIADSETDRQCKAGKTCYFAIYWCAGDLTVNTYNPSLICNGENLGNGVQTDSMSVDVSIRAVPTNENPRFLCSGGSDKVEGCSPGYWKQSQHFDDWTVPYTPTTLFSSVFENAFPGKTLLQVLELGGGGLNALGRQTVAALLNATNPDVGYVYTATEVISKFNNVFPGDNYESLKNDLEKQNTIYCPLSKGDY